MNLKKYKIIYSNKLYGGKKCKFNQIYDEKKCDIKNYHCLDYDFLRDIGASKNNKKIYCFNFLGFNSK